MVQRCTRTSHILYHILGSGENFQTHFLRWNCMPKLTILNMIKPIQWGKSHLTYNGPDRTKKDNSGGPNLLRMSSKIRCSLGIYVLMEKWFDFTHFSESYFLGYALKTARKLNMQLLLPTTAKHESSNVSLYAWKFFSPPHPPWRLLSSLKTNLCMHRVQFSIICSIYLQRRWYLAGWQS